MMTSWILLLGLICAIILSLFKVKNWKSYLVLSLQAVAVVLSLIGNPSLAFYLLGATCILAIINSITKPVSLKKWQSVFFFFPLILVFLFSGLNLPGANVLRFSMLLPIIVFGIILFQTPKPYKSISTMIVFVAFAVTELLELILP